MARARVVRKKRRKEPTTLTYRDLDYMKPEKFRNHLTLTELSRLVSKDIDWLRRLEAAGRISKAARVKMGQLEIRLWSPAQVEEIKVIMSQMRRGRPKGS